MPRVEQAAAAGRLARVVGFEQGVVALVPLAHEVEPALLNPALEVSGRDAVRPGEQGMVGLEHPQRRVLNAYPIASGGQSVRGEDGGRTTAARDRVVLHDERASIVHITQQALARSRHVGPGAHSPNAQDYGVEAAEIARGKIVLREKRDRGAELFEGLGNAVA